MKERTSIAIDAHVRRELRREAKEKGTSVSKLVGMLIADHLAKGKQKKVRFPCTVAMPPNAPRVRDTARNADHYAYDLED
jgi:hypothetical protein